MTNSPRILTIMGSGETSPTMVKTHRENISKFQDKNKLNSVILDTPFGFQGNADDIAAKAIEYFKTSVNIGTVVASFRSKKIDPLQQEKFFSQLDQADFIFAGPGSPTYALSQWEGTPVAGTLINKLTRSGGLVTFSSAAALTLGSRTVPVYEIYKVGLDPHWLKGLNVLGAIGVKGAVIPHFNNAEGGNHDTRFCYLGQDRLKLMEAELSPDESIYGIDEHTAIVIDLKEGQVVVTGNGTFNIRNQGRQVTFQSGDEIPLASLVNTELLFSETKSTSSTPNASHEGEKSDQVDLPSQGISPLSISVEQLKADFDTSLEKKDVDGAVKAVLALLGQIEMWQTETFQSDEMERAKSALRTMIVRLGQFATKGTMEPEEIYGPFVDLLLNLRLTARKDKRWDESDQIRDQLNLLGIEVRDIPGGSEWISIGKG